MGGCFSTSNKTANCSFTSTSSGEVSKVNKSSKKLGKAKSSAILGEIYRDVEDDYEIGKELGRGLFGITHRATNRKTGEAFACKTITKKRIPTNKHGSLRNEVAILKHVSEFKDIATFIDAYEDENFIHIILELCTGGMLYDSISAEEHYSEKKAALMLRNMVEIVQYIHSKGVIHRDLKLENFLLSSTEPDSSLKLIDFGLSTFFKPGQKFSEIVGSAYYVAPEVLKKNYSKECDIWSMGVILYMLLCGLPPFWHASEKGICDAVLKGEFDLDSDPWPSISQSAKDLIKRMLEMEPSQRITVPEILDNEWVKKDGCASSNPIACPIFNRVKQFMMMNRLKRHALSIIAEHCLDPNESQLIQEKFEYLDADKDGRLTFEELYEGLKKKGVNLEQEVMREIFDAADVDKNGYLDFSEYASAIMVKRLSEQRIKRAFAFYDKDEDGYLSIDNLSAAICMEDDAEGMKRILEEVDLKKDGKIDYEEFEAMMLDGSGGCFKAPPLSSLTDQYLCPTNITLSNVA